MEGLDAASELANHAVLAAHHRGVVRGHVRDADAEARRVGCQLVHLGAAEQGLGGDAAAVQADAAQAVGIDQDNPRVQRGGAQGRHVAAGSAAKHTHVGPKGHHVRRSCCRVPGIVGVIRQPPPVSSGIEVWWDLFGLEDSQRGVHVLAAAL